MNENTLEYHLNKVFEIAEKKYGVSDPLDKTKYREIIASEKFEHTLFEGASGGKYNDETYGADATDPAFTFGEFGYKVEYKSRKMTKTQYDKFLNGLLKKQFTMVYNGAYSFENINRYKDTRHILNVFYKAKMVVSVEVPTDYVIEILTKNLKDDNVRRDNGEDVTTNLNSVTIQFIDNKPTIGNVIYDCRND